MTAAARESIDQSRRTKPADAAPSLRPEEAQSSNGLAIWPGMAIMQQAFDYWVDAWQRSVLFLDVLRQRGNNHFDHIAQRAPHVLRFQAVPVMLGSELKRPVNYGLVWIVPPADIEIDPRKRPFIVFDPRAGHGPGIGGMKQDSEIGVALAAGHPCYFVGFTPEPVPGQTVEDVCRAEVAFIRKVIERHPEAEGKPCLIGNCQAGWQIMMTAAIEPDLAGPVLLAGSPLAYWAGVRGKNPMRYLGGLLGGTWLTSLAGDLGHGIFDGAYLVDNFESLNPANTYWQKLYNLYSKIDTEPPRFLEFEKWWGSPVLLNAQEMQYIADELFVGNNLASGEIYTSDGTRIDLRNIKSPIIVFCSWGDDITPPQQALDWILDLYDSDEELIASGQTIIYALHQSIGHLGIFVSAKVATKEHTEFTQAMDLIDTLPPGLYEMVITEKGPDTASAELVAGKWVVRFDARSLGHIRALGINSAEDEMRFATVARVSEINQGLYRTCLSPAIQAAINEQNAEWLRRMHPLRLRFEAMSDKNPWVKPVAPLADRVRANRRPIGRDNPFLAMQETVSRQIVEALDRYRDVRDWFSENLFMAVYGSPVLQAMVGLRSDAATARPRLGRDLARDAAAAKAMAELEAQIERGGLREAAVRAMVYVGMGKPQLAVDERGFAVLRQFRAEQPEDKRRPLANFKEMVREQYLILRSDEERAIATLPKLLPEDAAERAAAIKLLQRALSAAGEPSDEVKKRFARIEALFKAGPAAPERPGGTGWKVAAAQSRAPTRRRRRSEAVPGTRAPESKEKTGGA